MRIVTTWQTIAALCAIAFAGGAAAAARFRTASGETDPHHDDRPTPPYWPPTPPYGPATTSGDLPITPPPADLGEAGTTRADPDTARRDRRQTEPRDLDTTAPRTRDIIDRIQQRYGTPSGTIIRGTVAEGPVTVEGTVNERGHLEGARIIGGPWFVGGITIRGAARWWGHNDDRGDVDRGDPASWRWGPWGSIGDSGLAGQADR